MIKKTKQAKGRGVASNQDHPMTDKELMTKLKKYDLHAHFVAYEDLKTFERLDDHLPMILLYQLHVPAGHFVSLFLNKEGLNYFDSRAYVPDKLLETHFDHTAGREAMGADHTYLNELILRYLDEHDVKLIYNENKLQSQDSTTCGPWSAIRLIYGNVTNDEFWELWKDYDIKQRQDMILKLWNKL
jgi:hypothetical protein